MTLFIQRNLTKNTHCFKLTLNIQGFNTYWFWQYISLLTVRILHGNLPFPILKLCLQTLFTNTHFDLLTSHAVGISSWKVGPENITMKCF